MAAATITYDSSWATVVSVTGNITNNQVAGNTTVYTNTLNYPYANLEVNIPGGFSVAPTAGNTISVWAVPLSSDGTNYSTNGNGITSTPGAESGLNSISGVVYLGSVAVANSASAQTGLLLKSVSIDGLKGSFKVFIRNETGQTIVASGGSPFTVKLLGYSAG